MTDEMTDSKLARFTPAERAEIRQLAAAVIQAAQGDEEWPAETNIPQASRENRQRFDALVFKLCCEIEALGREREAMECVVRYAERVVSRGMHQRTANRDEFLPNDIEILGKLAEAVTTLRATTERGGE